MAGVKGRRLGSSVYTDVGVDVGAIAYKAANARQLWLTPGASAQVLTSAGVTPAIPGYATPTGGSGGSGKIAQVVKTETSAFASGSTVIPHDDTIPQSTEGDQYFSLTITPTDAASTLLIECNALWGSAGSSAVVTVALFQDSGVNAIAATNEFVANSGAAQASVFRHWMTAGTTSATTFKIRAGINATTCYLNGPGARRFGGVAASSFSITEILPGAGGSVGKILQVVNTQIGAVATGTTTIPHDDTVPQNTEGDQYMSLALTPTSATSKLKIEVVLCATHSAITWMTAALFQDSTAGALAAADSYQATGTGANNVIFTHYMTAGTTSATTFKVRAGGESGGTTTFNGSAASRRFGGIMASSITITEIAA